MKKQISETIDSLSDSFFEISQYIGKNPELGNEEEKACQPISPHTHEFREASLSREGFNGMIIGAKALALTGYEIASNRNLRQQISAEFKTSLR